MGHRVIFATGSEGKMKEIRALLGDPGLSALSIKEASVDLDIVEDGTIFGESVEIKAKTIWRVADDTVLADDSGPAMDYIGGESGIYSARYMGGDIPYEIKDRNTTDWLRDAEDRSRSVQFVCNIAAAPPDGRVLRTEETIEGMIVEKPTGSGGFGYDPILLLPRCSLTSTEITMEEKSKIGHRGKALRVIRAAPEKVLKREMEGTQDENINCQWYSWRE